MSCAPLPACLCTRTRRKADRPPARARGTICTSALRSFAGGRGDLLRRGAYSCTRNLQFHNAKFYSRFINAVAERLQAILPTVHAQHPIAPTKTTVPELLGLAASHRADRADLDGCPESREVVPISDLKRANITVVSSGGLRRSCTPPRRITTARCLLSHCWVWCAGYAAQPACARGRRKPRDVQPGACTRSAGGRVECLLWRSAGSSLGAAVQGAVTVPRHRCVTRALGKGAHRWTGQPMAARCAGPERQVGNGG